jgi:GDP-L-fucose synthase
MDKNAKIYVAGHRGMVGSAIVRGLQAQGHHNLVQRTHAELDLRNQGAVAAFFAAEQPDYVFLAAAKVGGILANNTYRAEFIYDNLMIQNNVVHHAWLNGVKKLLFLGSSCIYPKYADQPMNEDQLLTGILEPTNEPYAIAKIAGIKLCDAYRAQYGCDFISVMPTNLYGPNDNYDLMGSHVLPAMLRKFVEARRAGAPQVTLWGDGSPFREFLHVDDMAAACLHLMEHYAEAGLVNIGTGVDISIRDLAETIRTATGYAGEIVWDSSKPNGTPRKLMDVSKLHRLGFRHRIDLAEGIALTLADFEARYEEYTRGRQA